METELRALVSGWQIEEGEFGESACATAKQPRGAAAQNGDTPIPEADHVSERLKPSRRVEHHAWLELAQQADHLGRPARTQEKIAGPRAERVGPGWARNSCRTRSMST